MPRDPFALVTQVPGFAAIVRKKPRLVASVVRHQALRRLARRRGGTVLTSMEYAVSYACDARCGHCSSAGLTEGRREKERLGAAELRALAGKARKMGVYEVNLTGGEPTLRRDLEEIVGCFAPDRTFIGLNTHGRHLDERRVRGLASAGVDLLKLSLDSDVPEDHDRNRALPGAWHHVVWLLELVRSVSGLRAHVCAVGTPEMIRGGGARRLVELADRHDATIGFTLPAAVGRWGGRYEVQLEARDLASLQEICRHPRAFFQGSLGTGDFACPAGREEIYVTPWGDVLPCPFVQRSFDNVRVDALPILQERIGEAVAQAGGRSLCLAADAQRWMKSHLPDAGARLDLPTCAAEHKDGFCHAPVDPNRGEA